VIFIGADGGGTKTRLAAFENGVRIGESLAGPLNYRVIPPEEAAGHFLAGLDRLGIPVDRIAAVGIADPSLDDGVEAGDEAAETFYALLADALPCPLFARSDAVITLFGLSRGGAGTLVIAGTGSMGVARNAAGMLRFTGGWGRYGRDEGSGTYIAEEGIRAALRAADGLDAPTALTAAALQYFGADEPRRLIPILYGTPPPDIPAFAMEVARCAEEGDGAARRILDDAGDRLAEIAALLVRWSESESIGIWGSVLTKNKHVRERFESALRKTVCVPVTLPPVPAEESAALYAKECFKG